MHHAPGLHLPARQPYCNAVRRFLLNLLTPMLLAACSHVASTRASFQALSNSPPTLQLRIMRHLDTVVCGPDIEEDQILVITVRDYRLNEPIRLPSTNAHVTFLAKRFGPPSHALDSSGCITIRTVSADRVRAWLDLRLHTSTRDGSYRSTERFRGEHVFHAESASQWQPR